MGELGLLLLATGFVPLLQAWRRCRWPSLRHTLAWTLLAWLAWVSLLALAPYGPLEANRAGRYLALCLTGCAGVAVLGARRPGAAAWNFAVLGLLAVLVLFWAEGLLTGGTIELGGIRLVFLAGTLALVVLNYLPTRLGPAAVLMLIGCALELCAVSGQLPASVADLALVGMIFGLALWVGRMGLRWQRQPVSEVDRLWLDFRDHYGLVWGQRLREQFNRSAANSGLPVTLRWHGLEPAIPGALEPPVESASLATLQALLKRF